MAGPWWQCRQLYHSVRVHEKHRIRSTRVWGSCHQTTPWAVCFSSRSEQRKSGVDRLLPLVDVYAAKAGCRGVISRKHTTTLGPSCSTSHSSSDVVPATRSLFTSMVTHVQPSWRIADRTLTTKIPCHAGIAMCQGIMWLHGVYAELVEGPGAPAWRSVKRSFPSRARAAQSSSTPY